MFPKSIGLNCVDIEKNICVKQNIVNNEISPSGNNVLNEFLFNLPKYSSWRKYFFPKIVNWKIDEVSQKQIKTTQYLHRYSYTLSNFCYGRSDDGSTVGDISHFCEPFVFMVCKYILYIMTNSACGRIDVDSKIDNVVVRLDTDRDDKDVIDIVIIDNEHEFQLYNNSVHSGINVVSKYRSNERTVKNGIKTTHFSLVDVVDGIVKECIERIKTKQVNRLDDVKELLNRKEQSNKRYYLKLYNHCMTLCEKNNWDMTQLDMMFNRLRSLPLKQIDDKRIEIPSTIFSFLGSSADSLHSAHEDLINDKIGTLTNDILITRTLEFLLNTDHAGHKLLKEPVCLAYAVFIIRYHITALDRNETHTYKVSYMDTIYDIVFDPHFLNKSFETLLKLSNEIKLINKCAIRAYVNTMEQYLNIE